MKFEHLSILLGGPESLDRFVTLQGKTRVMFVNTEEELAQVRDVFSSNGEVQGASKKRGRKPNPARNVAVLSSCGPVTVKVKQGKPSKTLE